ncbi:arylsulfotransferase family protein (plasmid) [Roseobacteraceae bacterium NS-SX3]
MQRPDPPTARSRLWDWLSLGLFACSCAALIFAAGMFAARYRLFPYPQVEQVIHYFKSGGETLPWIYFRDSRDSPVAQHAPGRAMPGLTLFSGAAPGEKHMIAVAAPDGQIVQRWETDWEALWPGPAPHVPPAVLEGETKHVHGMALLPDGDIVFNITGHGMFRLSPCGGIRWRLARASHHAIWVDGSGSIWAPGEIRHTAPDPRYPNHKPPFFEFTLLKVSAETGEVLREISVNDLLLQNGLPGLLYLSTINQFTPIVTRDTLHLNDAEVFPETLEEGVFRHGDVMISLRNINTVLVFDPKTLKIRWISTGAVMRQHDPDFIDGNTVSVFDNNNLLGENFDNASGKRHSQGQRSRVVTLSARDNRVLAVEDGGAESRFFTDIMGSHQRLENGNMLIVESRTGRLLELAPDGTPVWEFFNIAGPGLLGVIDDAQRLPVQYDAEFFRRARAACSG